MATPARAKQAADLPWAARHRLTWRDAWLIAGVSSVAIALTYLALVLIKWPFTERALINVLQERSVRQVTIARFSRTYWPPGCVAEGIRFLHRRQKNRPPLITIDKLAVEATYPGLLFHKRLSKVRAIGMHLIVPPSQSNGKLNPIPLTQSSSNGPTILIGQVIADGAVLDFLSPDNEPPFRILIDKLSISGVGNNRPLLYRAIISNTVPPGKIRSNGAFGPWNPDDPALTPVNGSYTYENADLAIFHGISGTLASSGKFTGTLGRIAVTGSAQVPNFHVGSSSHTTKLSAEFHAAVDATGGDTALEDVVAHFNQTTAFFKGAASGRPGEDGKHVSLDMWAAHGRVEDLLDLVIGSPRAPMTGDISFRGHVELPATQKEFLKKLMLTGDFGIAAGKFTNPRMQTRIDRLSAANRKPSATHNVGSDFQTGSETALSDLKGHVSVRNGIASLSNVSFRIPEAKAWMHGVYGLVDYRVDLHGRLLCDHPSGATTGFKSLLMKALDPFLKKRGKEKIVPFKITGTFQKANIGLELNSKK